MSTKGQYHSLFDSLHRDCAKAMGPHYRRLNGTLASQIATLVNEHADLTQKLREASVMPLPLNRAAARAAFNDALASLDTARAKYSAVE